MICLKNYNQEDFNVHFLVDLYLMKKVFKTSAKSVLTLLELITAMPAADAGIHKKF